MAYRGKKIRSYNKNRKPFAHINFSFLPSMFTLFNLLLGYLSVINVVNQNYKGACVAIIAAMIMDGFDGTVARLTKTVSDFGFQLDSLVDAVSFGFATSFLIYMWGFASYAKDEGKIFAFMFLSAGVIRLARFNVYGSTKTLPKNVFIGLPIPFAAMAIISVVLFKKTPFVSYESGGLFFAVYVLIISFLMVSNIKYRTIKKLNNKGGLPILLLIALIVAMGLIFPEKIIPLLTLLYIISPLFFLILSFFSKKKKPSNKQESSESYTDDNNQKI